LFLVSISSFDVLIFFEFFDSFSISSFLVVLITTAFGFFKGLLFTFQCTFSSLLLRRSLLYHSFILKVNTFLKIFLFFKKGQNNKLVILCFLDS